MRLLCIPLYDILFYSIECIMESEILSMKEQKMKRLIQFGSKFFFFAQHPVIYVPSQLFKNLLHCGKQLYNNIIIAMNIQVVRDLD